MKLRLATRLPRTDPNRAARVRERAIAAQSARSWRMAHDLWKEVVDLDPADAGAWIQLGNMLNELGRREESVHAFEQAGGLDPSLVDVPAGVAGVHERSERWPEALSAWRRAITLMEQSSGQVGPDRLAHAFGHAALAATLAGRMDEAGELLETATRSVPDFEELPDHYVLRARVMKSSNPEGSLRLLRRHIALHPEALDARYEIAAITLDTGEYEAGLEALAPALVAPDTPISFLWLAADLEERLLRWTEVMLLAERMAERAPHEQRYLDRAFTAAAAIPDLTAARRIARQYVVEHSELLLIHRLLRLYEDAGELTRARLLCRWLCRRWGHSRWHVRHYITLTAATRSLSEADRLVRREVNAGRRDLDVERGYCEAAHRSGDHGEARRRLEAYLVSHPDDDGMRILLGYVLANTAGIAAAEQHFAELASRGFQSESALIGLAHMAMRKRDMIASFDRWAKLAILYPEHTIGFVEYARAAYEMREPELAREICERRLRELPGDVTMGEFYAWLLAATGSFREAWAYLRRLRHRTGPNWAVLELSIQCAAAAGDLDAAVPDILADMPKATTRAAARRFYHVVRQLVCADRPDLLPAAFARTSLPPRHLPWLAPYLQVELRNPSALSGATVTPVVAPNMDDAVGGQDGFGAGIRAHWGRASALVSYRVARRLATMSDMEVEALLARPSHEQPVVHVVNKFEQTRGGSELHALDVAARIGGFTKVRLWAPEMPHPEFTTAHQVATIDLGQGVLPRGGVLVLIGVYFEIDSWIGLTRPDRVLILYNTFEAPSLFDRIAEIHDRTGVRAELIFCSDMMGHECGLPGQFEPSPTDIDLFRPRPEMRLSGHKFTVGRHSRDVVEKHHPEDWRIYEAVANSGGVSRLLGGTCMRPVFPAMRGVEFLPARTAGIAEFLQRLDAYVYRTSTWVEPWGRVVIEAMACGLPVLAHERGGYAQAIRHEQSGLLFHTTEEAVRLIRRLATEDGLRARLGASARHDAARLLDGAAMARLVAFYLASDIEQPESTLPPISYIPGRLDSVRVDLRPG